MILSKTPITRTFFLKADPEGKASVTIRQANNGDEMDIAKLGERQRWSRNVDGTNDLVVQFNYEETKRLQVKLVLTDTAEILDDEGKSAFTFRMGKNGNEIANTDQFNATWARMDVVVADEIYEYVLDVNPNWDTAAEGK